MKLTDFIESHTDTILAEWEEFAASIPGTGKMDKRELQDHARAMLETILHVMNDESDLRIVPTHDGYHRANDDGGGAGAQHAFDRLDYGFTIYQIMAEFRALRASVLRLWARNTDSVDPESLEELTRFNDGIDRVLMDSVSAYSTQMDKSREMFLGILGHDLRNPLTAMTVSATMLQRDKHATAEQLQRAATIVQSGERIGIMLSDLLDFARVRLGGSIPLRPVRTDLREVAESVLTEQRAAHPAVVLRESYQGDLAGNWDPERLHQLLDNLVSNAIKHGSTSRPIELRACNDGDCVRIEVRNRGNPIPESAQRSIFDPLTALRDQSGARTVRTGIGLGLYICRLIAEAHRGRIDVASSEGEGTVFTVTLPYEAPPERARDQ